MLENTCTTKNLKQYFSKVSGVFDTNYLLLSALSFEQVLLKGRVVGESMYGLGE